MPNFYDNIRDINELYHIKNKKHDLNLLNLKITN